MAEHEYEVRPRGRDEAQRLFEAQRARRRRRAANLADIAPAQLKERLKASGARFVVEAVRVVSPSDSWRWPWATLERLDVIDCDFDGVGIASGLIRGSRLDDCRFVRTAMGGAHITGTTFNSCRFEDVGFVGNATSTIRNSTFRGCSFTHVDARGVQFDGVTFEDCDIDGVRGRATIFKSCTFVRTRFRGKVTGIVLDGCSFDGVDMGEVRLSRSFIIDSRRQREFLFPADPSGFAIDYQAYRAAVEDLAPSLTDADAAAIRAEVGSWATNPPGEILIDDGTFASLSPDGRAAAMSTLFAHRLARRG